MGGYPMVRFHGGLRSDRRLGVGRDDAPVTRGAHAQQGPRHPEGRKGVTSLAGG